MVVVGIVKGLGPWVMTGESRTSRFQDEEETTKNLMLAMMPARPALEDIKV